MLTTVLEELEQDTARFDPQLIISSQPKPSIKSSTLAWIKVSTDAPTRPTEIWLGEDRWEATAPHMDTLAQVIDSLEDMLAPTEDPDNRLSRTERSRSSI